MKTPIVSARKIRRKPAAPEPYHHGDLKNVVLRVAEIMLAEVGAEGMSLRKLAQQIGVSHAALYRHYPDKQSLLVELAREGFVCLREGMQAAVQREPPADLRAQLRAALDAYVGFAYSDTARFRLMYGTELADRETYPELLSEVEGGFQLLHALVGGAQAAGVVRSGDIGLILTSAFAAAHGLAVLAVNGLLRVGSLRDVPRETLIESTWNYLWVGIGAATSR